jgi:hypothetical protein
MRAIYWGEGSVGHGIDVGNGWDGLVVVKCLAPCDESKACEGLGLEFEGEVEVLCTRFSMLLSLLNEEKSYLDYGVYTEWDAAFDELVLCGL